MSPDNKQLYKASSHGTYGEFRLVIEVGATKLPDLKDDGIWQAGHRAAKLIEAAVMEVVVRNDPDAQLRASKERFDILSLFPTPIYVEIIPNGYCHDWCCKHLPWFLVTTKVGVFEIGWRKRVISIDWEKTRDTKTAAILFPDEDVTKGGRSIHAWSLDHARRYIDTVINTSGKDQANGTTTISS